jgi:hypothetical protein
MYASPNIIRMIKSMRMRWDGHVARMRYTRNACKILIRRTEGERSVGRYKHRWEDNIRMDPRERVWEGMDWIQLVQDRDQWRALVIMVINLRFP